MATPNRFFHELIVSEPDIDFNNHVNNLVYLQWVQLVSGLHWDHRTTVEQRANCFWVIARQEIDYLRELKLNEKVLIETFIERVEKQKCYRTVLIYKKDSNELAARAQIVWVLLDPATKRPMRISDDVIQPFIS